MNIGIMPGMTDNGRQLPKWIPGLDNLYPVLIKIRDKCSPFEWFDKKFPGDKRTAEVWVFSWLVIEIGLYLLSFPMSDISISWIYWLLTSIFTAVFLFRLIGILMMWIINYIFQEPGPRSRGRFIILTLFNYTEVTVIFGALAFLYKHDFVSTNIPIFVNSYPLSFSPGFESFQYSLGIATSLGSKFEPSGPLGYLIFVGQILFVITFVTVVIQIAISSKDNDENNQPAVKVGKTKSS
jgi:hypothetical protein